MIFFADEGGSWMVGVDWRQVLPAWFRVLSATASPAEIARRFEAFVAATGRCTEMLARQVQIDGRLFEVTMAEQQLDSAQVGTRFQQMRRETMPQRVRVDMVMCKSGAFGSVLTSIPKNLGCDGATARVPAVAGEQPLGGLVAKSTPIATKGIEQSLA